jgi:mRNA interferase MazF
MAIHRGDIFFVNLDPVIGREQAGSRPVLVVSTDDINSRPLVATVVVGTDGANVPRDYVTNVRVSAHESGLPHETVFLCFQMPALDSRRCPARPAGKLGSTDMGRVERAIKHCLGLE